MQSFFERNGVPKTPSELGRLPAVVYSVDRVGGGDLYHFRQGEEDVEVKLSGRLRVSAAEAVREAVLGGLGYRTVRGVGDAAFGIDLGVLHPDSKRGFLLGIECDGGAHYTGRSPRMGAAEAD